MLAERWNKYKHLMYTIFYVTEVKNLKPTGATAKEIKKITFEIQQPCMQHVNIYNSVQVYTDSSHKGNMNMQSHLCKSVLNVCPFSLL